MVGGLLAGAVHRLLPGCLCFAVWDQGANPFCALHSRVLRAAREIVALT